jgi:hypothetical protein
LKDEQEHIDYAFAFSSPLVQELVKKFAEAKGKTAGTGPLMTREKFDRAYNCSAPAAASA